jgi:exopolyphosphatase/guanosine-5'-triphosphate,3'-diphosphate pyrophosphatase
VKTLATIDVGTNTTLLLVARGAPGAAIEVLADRAEITRLGRGIGGAGRLSPTGIEATLAALREYAALARSHGARLAAVGTEALRRAPNADEFLLPAREILGVEVEVIDGGREAALTFRAVIESFPHAAADGGSLVVVDIGGGSTEIIVARRGQVQHRSSLPIGSVWLTERHLRHDPAHGPEVEAVRAEIRAALQTIPFPAGGGGDAAALTLVGVAGTVTSLAAMAQGLACYDPARVHGFALARAELDGQIARLLRMPQAERERIVGLDPRRADVILAGALILCEIVRNAGVDTILVSDRGIRWGLLYEAMA